MNRPKFLDVKEKELSCFSYAMLSLFLLIVVIINLFADLYDYTVKIVFAIALFLFFIIATPIQLLVSVKNFIFSQK